MKKGSDCWNMGGIPVTTRVHEENQTSKVYFEPGGDDAYAFDELRPGHQVLILGRIHELNTSGGYDRINGDQVQKKARFTLDIGDIVLVGIFGPSGVEVELKKKEGEKTKWEKTKNRQGRRR